MHRMIFLSIPFLVWAVTAFTLPGNQADGVYLASSKRGEEVHTLIASATDPRDLAHLLNPSEITERSGEISKRASTLTALTYCGCGFNVDPGNTDLAVADLKNQVGADNAHGVIIGAAESYYSVRGNVVVFVCNRDGNSKLKVWTDIITQSAGQITSNCGKYVSGTVGGITSFAIGYMQYSQGTNFCGNAEGSGKNHC